MAVRAFMILLLLPFVAHSLQSMNDDDMSIVVAQEGIRLLTEYEATIDSVQYFDDKNPLNSSDLGGGSLSFVNVNVATRAQQIIDLQVLSGKAASDSQTGVNRSGRKGIRLSSQELPIDISVGSLRIGGASLGQVGMTGFTTGKEEPIVFDIWAGGADDSGLTFDVVLPKKSSYDLYYEDDGTRLSANINYCSNDTCTTGGLTFENFTFDVVAKGVRVGLPTIKNGTFNVKDFRIGTSKDKFSKINDLSFQNINMGSGGKLVLGASEQSGETAINFDLELASTSFDFLFYDTSDNARDSIAASIEISGISSAGNAKASGQVNVLEENGLRVDFQSTVQIVATDIVMRPNGVTDAPVLGSLELNLQLLNESYLEIMGH